MGKVTISYGAIERDNERRAKKRATRGSMINFQRPRHFMSSKVLGESHVERLAKKIENRRNGRIPVTFEIRKLFLETCQDVATEHDLMTKIPVSELIKLRDEYKEKVDKKNKVLAVQRRSVGKLLGFWDKDAVLLALFERGVANVTKINGKWFFFRDFNFYHTVIHPTMDIFNGSVVSAIVWLLLFYFGSALFFCGVIEDDQICPSGLYSYEGWLTTIYFASATMSTVGYGDVTISGQEDWKMLIGIVYMLIALVFGYTVFATAAEVALGDFDMGGFGVKSYLFRTFLEDYDGTSVPLYRQVRRVVTLRVVELVGYFLILNIFGAMIERLFVDPDRGEEKWSWMTTVYWSVQTTTTIGYGDLDMPFQLRWFNIFFTTLGTAFVGSVFGGVASLRNDIQDLRRYYAWKRREVSKRLIEDMKGVDSDDQLDQFEFMVGSLLMLNKIQYSDVQQIMDKFRELAGDKGYIIYDEEEEEAEVEEHLAESLMGRPHDWLKYDVDGATMRF